MSTEPIRVLVADDNDRFRAGLCSLIRSTSDTELAGEAATGREVVDLAERLQPDVILMDLKMPGLNGIEATRLITETSPHIGILALTMLEDDDTVFEALRAGARGYLLKGSFKAEILRSIRAINSGDAIFGPAIARRLTYFFAAPRTGWQEPAFPELTAREQEILVLVAQHQTNPEIARLLGLSPKTVRNHVSNIFAKLQVADRAEAIVRARDAGLAPPGRLT